MTSHGRRWAAAARRAGVAVLVAAGLAVGGASAPAAAYDEGTIVALVNEARGANGLYGLVSNPSLDAVALGWAQQLVANGSLSHNPSVGDQIPGGWTAWGENVAQGYVGGAAVHDGWMDSPGHRANVLGDFTDIGVAFIDGGGTTWAVEVFATYPGSGGAPPPAPAPEAPAEAAPVEVAPAPAPTPTVTATPSATPTVPASPTPPATLTATPAAADTRSDAAASPWWLGATAIGAAAVLSSVLLLPAIRRRVLRRRA